METPQRIAVIYIDMDDDLGQMGFRTPIIGGEEALRVIHEFMAKRPEDSDLNALIVAYNVFKELKGKGVDAELVLLSGSSEGSTMAQLEFSRKLDEVLEKGNFNGAFVVYDSPEDAQAIPIIQSRVKIIGIRRVIVEQSRGVEETYALLARYIRKVLTEPRLARTFVGAPGVLLLVIGVLSLAGLGQFVGPAALTVLGLVFIIRGYNLDELFEKWWENSPLMVISSIISIIIIVIGGVYSSFSVSIGTERGVLEYLAFAESFTPFLAFSLVVLLSARAVTKLLSDEKYTFWHDVYKIGAIAFIFWILNQSFSQITKLNLVEVISQTVPQLLGGTVALIIAYVVLYLVEREKRRKNAILLH